MAKNSLVYDITAEYDPLLHICKICAYVRDLQGHVCDVECIEAPPAVLPPRRAHIFLFRDAFQATSQCDEAFSFRTLALDPGWPGRSPEATGAFGGSTIAD